jgi:hypothetical protein
MSRRMSTLVAAVAALAVLAGLAGAVLVRGVTAGALPLNSGWAIPLVAGGSVGLLSWFLLAGRAHGGSTEPRRAMVRCASCGTELLEEWRLCPYCGVASGRAEREIASVSGETQS